MNIFISPGKKSVLFPKTLIFVGCFFCSFFSNAQRNQDREYYKITIYHYKAAAQEAALDNYLEYALLPALHRHKVSDIGVFKAFSNDTAADKLLYVFMPIRSLKEAQKMEEELSKDNGYTTAGDSYINATFDKPVYTRMETILLYAFPLAPKMQLPQLQTPGMERVYELRSYESASEKIFRNKVKMFNEGGEIVLFKRLGFNAVFYSEVIAGPKMPNLMYMTTFENMKARDDHWKAFSEDAEWKKISGMPEYQKNVQHIDIIFLRPTHYSDF